jgi:hypothetical protein
MRGPSPVRCEIFGLSRFSEHVSCATLHAHRYVEIHPKAVGETQRQTSTTIPFRSLISSQGNERTIRTRTSTHVRFGLLRIGPIVQFALWF